MTTTEVDAATLEAKAQEFAGEVTGTIRDVLGSSCPTFVVEASPKLKGDRQRLSIHPEDAHVIPMRIDGQHALSLVVDFDCPWDHSNAYLMVQRATFKVEPAGKGEPLFRYEFLNELQSSHLPSAHLHVHAHRDEFLFAMFRGKDGRPKKRAKAVTGEGKGAVPRLSKVHFPLGGARMRPCLEDILEMLHVEFGVDVEPGALAVLEKGRARWRRRQIGAGVRDAPEEAVRVLREIGYEIHEHPKGPRPDRMDKLTSI